MGNLLQLLPLRGVQLQARMQAQRHVLLHAEVREQVVLLKQHRNRALRRYAVGVIRAVNAQRALADRQKSGDQAEQRAFACTARAEHSQPLAALSAKAETHRQMLIEVGQISQCQHGGQVIFPSG